MSPSHLASLVTIAGLVVSAPALAQEPLALRAERHMSSAEAEAFGLRLERLSGLVASGALSPKELTDLKEGLHRACSSVVITGEVRDVPLSDALLTIVRLGREQGRGPSLVIREADLAALGAVRVSALFSSTRATDAVRALLRSQDAAETLSLEVTEENDVFVVAVHRWEEEEAEEPEVDERRKQPADGRRPVIVLEEEEELTHAPGYLGIGASSPTPPEGEVVIGSVDASGPAAVAGLQTGDVISELDGEPVTSWGDLRARVRAKGAGTDVVLDVVRAGQRRRVIVTLGRAP